ncbi:response regulator transcription factor [Cryobacterium zhongshanensis]|uniref:Response regulator transcription factor n=1 Tax=Cryobacterium zhongshanensis TaxID=2928153 RepID=A0AA41QXJ2_9MICO|nr:response regulator transcription factor [Cryobacterium zhongshanensis]MCI4659486.1 response regulator transcription factor [Cryobacterium zhongshanensis]
MKLIVADDSALLREGLVSLLERQGHEVIVQAASAPELMSAIATAVREGRCPDVVITDVRMPPGMGDDGLAAAIAIRRDHPGMGILVLSQYVATAHATDLFSGWGDGLSMVSPHDAGGLGYLLKDRISRVADFMRSLSIIAAGGVVVDPEVAARLIHGRRTALDLLSVRELEVLELMSQGSSNQQIAERLYLSASAVSKHVTNVFMKLGLPAGEDNRRVRAVLAYLTAHD